MAGLLCPGSLPAHTLVPAGPSALLLLIRQLLPTCHLCRGLLPDYSHPCDFVPHRFPSEPHHPCYDFIHVR